MRIYWTMSGTPELLGLSPERRLGVRQEAGRRYRDNMMDLMLFRIPMLGVLLVVVRGAWEIPSVPVRIGSLLLGTAAVFVVVSLVTTARTRREVQKILAEETHDQASAG